MDKLRSCIDCMNLKVREWTDMGCSKFKLRYDDGNGKVQRFGLRKSEKEEGIKFRRAFNKAQACDQFDDADEEPGKRIIVFKDLGLDVKTGLYSSKFILSDGTEVISTVDAINPTDRWDIDKMRLIEAGVTESECDNFMHALR